MGQFEEFYRILDVALDASEDEIRSAYRTMVNVWHPDRFAHDPRLQTRAAEKLRAINGAFERIKQAPLRDARVRGASMPSAAAEPPGGGQARVTGDTRSAEEWFEIGVRLADSRVEMKAADSLTWSNIGNVKRHLEGIQAYQEAVRLKPDFPEAWYRMGLAHAQFHQFIEAARAFGETVRLRPDQASAWMNLGAALAQLEKYPEVIQAFREAVRLKPADASAWYTLGVAYAHPQIRRYEEARNAFGEAVRLKPELAEAWHALGRVCLQVGADTDRSPDADEALRAFREAVLLKPDLAEAWCSLGTTLSRLGRYNDALDALRQALRLKPDLVEAWYGIGTTSRLGRRPEAARDVEEAYANLKRLDRKEAARFLETLPRHQRLWLAWRGDR